MASLFRAALILSMARLMNYALLLFSPLILVRLLDVESYGQYREFLLYSSVLIVLASLAIKDNLLFVIPKHPQKAALATSQTANLLLLSTISVLGVFALGQHWFMAQASFDFAMPLVLYVFFFLSHDILENYWIAQRRPTLVLVFSVLRTLFRLTVVLVVAYTLRDVQSIVTAIILAEALKWLVSLGILLRLRLLPLRVDRVLLQEQLRFIVPLSAAGVVLFVNERAGHLFVSTMLGVSALAVYTVGTYQLPVIAVVRSAVADTLFPEMVKRSAVHTQQALELWKTATLYYFALVLPVVVVLMYYAELFVATLFTNAYLEAADVFRFALLIMLRQCFEVGTPLRALNANKHMLTGNLLAMLVHLPLLYFAVQWMGIAGAAFAWVVADLIAASYLAVTIKRLYGVTWEALARWRKIAVLAGCAALAGPVLLLERVLPFHEIIRAGCTTLAYGCCYLLLLRLARIEEIQALLHRIAAALGWRARSRVA